jgi:hypothetical protein
VQICDYVPIEEWSNELAVYGKVKVESDWSRKWKRGLTARNYFNVC